MATAAPSGALGRVRAGLAHPATAVLRASVVSQVALLVSGPIVLRLLGVTDRGELALVWAVVLLVSQVGVLGVPAAVARYVAARGLSPAALLARLQRRFAAQALAASAVAGLVVVALHLFDQPLGRPLLLAIVVALGSMSVMVAMLGLGALQGAQRFRLLAWLQPVPAVGYAVVVSVLLLVGATPSVALLLGVNLVGWAVVAVASLLLAVRLPGGSGGVPRTGQVPQAAEVSAYGRRSFAATAAPIDTLGIEQLLLGLVAGHYVLGLFSVGWAFESGPVFLLVALASYAGGRVGALAEPGPFVRRWLLAGALLAVVSVVAILLVLEPVLLWAFGAAAAPAVPLAQALVAAGGVLGLRRLTAALLVGLGAGRAASWCELAGLFAMLAGMGMLVFGWWPVSAPGWVLLLAGAVTLFGQVVVLARVLSDRVAG